MPALLNMVTDDPAMRADDRSGKPAACVLPDGSRRPFPIDSFSKTCLLNGVDELGYLLSFEEQITAYEAA